MTSPTGKMPSPISVVVLSCGPLGAKVANRLAELPEVGRVALVTTPNRVRVRRGLDKVRHVLRYDGVSGLGAAVLHRLRKTVAVAPEDGDARPPALVPGVSRHHFRDFHEPDCVTFLRSLAPDLGVLAGVYILKESVFSIAKLGSINLHTGKVPKYRGAAPAFWEMYNGETEVGVTVHWVTSELDGGAVIRQRLYPLDPAPGGDPLEYITRYRKEVLLPHGVNLLADAVKAIANGQGGGEPQNPDGARTYRTPQYRDKKELRRRVRQRRNGAR